MKIHILGICGTFMGGLAQILIEKGIKYLVPITSSIPQCQTN